MRSNYKMCLASSVLLAAGATVSAQTACIVGWPNNSYVWAPSVSGTQYQRPPAGAFVKVATGFGISAGIRLGGTLQIWGQVAATPLFGPWVPPSSWDDYVDVSCSWSHGVALKADGTAICWGEDWMGALAVPPGKKFYTVSAGEYFTLGIVKDPGGPDDRKLLVWGDPFVVNLFPASVTNRKFIAALAGGHHVLGLMDDGTGAGELVSWGKHDYLTMACLGPNCDNLNPIATRYVSIAAAHMNDIATRSDGSVEVWGSGGAQLQNVPSPNNFLAVYTGRQHATGRVPMAAELIPWGTPLYAFPVPPAGSAQLWNVSSGNSNTHHLALSGCFANCDGSTGSPLLTANDFQCFAAAYGDAAALNYNDPVQREQQIWSVANCDGSTSNPVLTANDFMCFSNAYTAGCT